MSQRQSVFVSVCMQLLVVGATVLLIPDQVLAEGEPFGVDSYVPEKFVDTKWRVSGGLSLSGGDSKQDLWRPPTSPPTSLTSEWNSDAQTLNMTSSFRYRYETIQDHLDAQLFLTASYSESENGSSYDFSRDTYDYHRTSGSSSETESYRSSVETSVDAGTYLLDDFFVSSLGEMGLSYTDRPTRDRSDWSHRVSAHPNGVVLTYSSETHRHQSDDSKYYRAAIALLPGWGRVYEGEYAATAMYIVDELTDNGLLTQAPDSQQMASLTELIHQNRLQHSVDYRLRKIEAIGSIAEYLTSEGIMVDPGPLGYLLIDDVWMYFPMFSRRFGFKARAGFGIDYEYDGSQRTYREDSFDFRTLRYADSASAYDSTGSERSYHRYNYHRTTLTAPHFIAQASFSRPFNHRWQLDASAQVRHYFGVNPKTIEHYINYGPPNWVRYDSGHVDYSNFYYFECSAIARYILNSRTDLALSAGMGYDHFDREVSEFRERDSDTTEVTYDGASFGFWSYGIGLTATYRISIPTTLTVRATYDSGPIKQGSTTSSTFRRTGGFLSRYPSAGYDDYSRDDYRLSATIAYYIM